MRFMTKIIHIDKMKIIIWGILGMIFLYYLYGIFPLTRFETDSMAIANACEEMIRNGNYEENVLGHSYHMQSGTYFLIINLSKLTGLSAFSSYSFLNILFAILYWLFLLLLLKKITNTKPAFIITILFLFQEIFILSYYANSAVIASAVWMIAFYILWTGDKNHLLIVSGILLAIAAWFRVDVAFTYPSVFILLYMKNRDIKNALTKSIVLGAMVITITLLLMNFMNANINGFIGYTNYEGDIIRTEHNLGLFDIYTIKAHAAYFSILTAFLVLTSIIILVSKKKYINILFLISGISIYYLIGINNAIAPKHLSYFTFYWVLIILTGFNEYKNIGKPKKYIIVITAILLFTIQYIIGVRAEINTLQYQEDLNSTLKPEPTIKTLGLIEFNKLAIKNISIVIGAGTKISTSDELSASSGLLYTPIMWNMQKEGLYKSFNELTGIIKANKTDTIWINTGDGSTQFVLNNLFSNDYNWKENTIDYKSNYHRFTFIKEKSPTVIVTRYTLNKNNFDEFITNIVNKQNKNLYLIFIWDWQNYKIKQFNIPMIENITYQIHKVEENNKQ